MATFTDDALDSQELVVAIDFGTTYSGYAFAYQRDYTLNRKTLHIHSCEYKSGYSLKAPTCVLLDPQGRFDSFGFDAEDKYAELTSTNEHQDWFYFRRFKMMLYNNKNITRQSTLKDDTGKTMNAIKVFSAIILHLRETTVRKMRQRSVGARIQDDKIHWVLTVPAIWSDQAKQFMRESAKNAGIRSDQLDIALEPEAASIYCKHMSVNRREQQQGGDDSVELETFRPGTKYMVLDAGGGTIDITVQQIQEDGSLHQVYMANGGDWGGTCVDNEFETLLIDLVGQEVWDRYKIEYMDNYIDIFREFETKKRTITPASEDRVTFKVPATLRELYEEMQGDELVASTSLRRADQKIYWKGDKLRVDHAIAKELFKRTCETIIKHVGGVFEEEEASGTSVILMVGGFSESPMLRHAVKERFSHRMRIIIPEEAGLSVLKGAVLFGFDSKVISRRVMKHTYGIQTSKEFRKNLDPDNTKTMVKGRLYCEDRFSKHTGKGQSVTIDEETDPIEYNPLDDTAKMAVKVYISDKCDPEYCDADLCTYIGQMLVSLPMDKPISDRGVEVRMKFGGTELSVRATVISTKETTHAEFNLLE